MPTTSRSTSTPRGPDPAAGHAAQRAASFDPEHDAELRAGESSGMRGRIEVRGVDYIPQAERRNTPTSMFWMLGGGSLALSVAVVGSLPVAFGLSWWASLSSIVVGTLAGALLLTPMALFGPRTGTNNPVASGAHFGVVGRVIGSLLSVLGAVGFAAIAVWACGDAIVGAIARALDVTASDGVSAVAYVVVGAVVMTIAIYGYHLMLRVIRYVAPVVALTMLLGVVALAGRFDAGYAGTPDAYLLGTFSATWMLSVTVVLSTVLSYVPFLGDWSRYLSDRRHSRASILTATFLAVVIGMGGAFFFGAFTAAAIADPAIDWIVGLAAQGPGWYVPLLALAGLLGATSQGAICIYGTGLDFASLVPALSRMASTLLFGLVTVALVCVGTFVFDARDSVSSFLVVLVILVVPWATIMVLGYWHRRAVYYPDDLQVFNRRETGGRYWFTRGINLRATVAWAIASVVGLLFASSTLFTGPFADVASGVDLSFIVSAVLAAALYLALLIAFPEPRASFGPGGPAASSRRTDA